MLKWKKAKINLSNLVFLTLSTCIQNLKTRAFREAGKYATKVLLKRKQKWTIKENGKQEESDSLLHTKKSYPMSVSNCKIIGPVVPEKFLIEIFIIEKETWINKGNDKQEKPDSLLHNTASHIQHLVIIIQHRVIIIIQTPRHTTVKPV